MISHRRSLALLLLSAVPTLAASGCAGGSLPGTALAPTSAAKPARARATARFTIAIPRKRHDRTHRSRYVSPSSQSMSISIAPASGGSAVVTKDVNLTPTSNGCALVSGATQCTFTVAIAAGSYLATIDTFDAVNEEGNLVSRGQQLPMSVLAGVTNAIALTLGGVPHSLTVSAGSAAIAGTQTAGFSFSAAAPLIVTALDADGNTIVGAGTPYTGSVVSGSGWSIASSPGAGTPNELSVTPGKSGSSATLKITVGYDASTCALQGVVCSATFAAASTSIQYLFVGDCEMLCGGSTIPDAVDVYQSPYTGSPIASITTGIDKPVAFAVAASGRLYVANCGTCYATGLDEITVYDPPFSAASAPIATITSGIAHPIALALNSSGDLFVWNCLQSCLGSGSDTIARYTGSPSNASTPATTIVPPFYTGHIAVDSSDNLLLLGCPQLGCYDVNTNPASVLAYAPPYNGAPVTVTNGIPSPTVLGVDGNGHMFVGGEVNCANPPCSGYLVTAYSVPYSASSAPIATISNGIDNPTAIVADASGNVYVANNYGKDVTAYPPGFSDASPLTLFAGSGYAATTMARDDAGDIFLSDENTVQLGVSPYTSLTAIAAGLHVPSAIAVSP